MAAVALGAVDAQRAKASRGRRRSSIPDLISETKRLVWGGGGGGGSRQKAQQQSAALASAAAAATVNPLTDRPPPPSPQPPPLPRMERRSTFKQHPTCDLPDVKEDVEETAADVERRHSLETNARTPSVRRLSAQRFDLLTIGGGGGGDRLPPLPRAIAAVARRRSKLVEHVERDSQRLLGFFFFFPLFVPCILCFKTGAERFNASSNSFLYDRRVKTTRALNFLATHKT